MKYVKFKDPLILDGLLDSFKPLLDQSFFYRIKSNTYAAREINNGDDEPGDLVNIFVPYKEIHENRNSQVAYLINYHGYDILVWDEYGHKGRGEEKGNILPDELFEI